MSGTPTHRPWPMKWIVLSILLFIAAYTLVMLKYRKASPAYRPYQDSVDRATVTRLLDSGYQRIPLTAEQPADLNPSQVLGGGKAVLALNAPAGLPEALNTLLIEKPVLAESFDRIHAPSSASASQALRILLTARQSDHRLVITGGELFRQGNTLVLIPRYEKIGGALQARWDETSHVLTIPAKALPAGDYELTLPAKKASKRWSFSVRP